MRGRSALAALVVLAACGDIGKSDARVQKLVDVYVPGIKIGEQVSPALRAQMHLETIERIAVIDTGFAGTDGVRRLLMTQDVAHQIESVQLGLPNAAAFALVRARVTKALGKPNKDICIDDARSHGTFRMQLWMVATGRSVVIGGHPEAWASSNEADTLATNENWVGLNVEPLPIAKMESQNCPVASGR